MTLLVHREEDLNGSKIFGSPQGIGQMWINLHCCQVDLKYIERSDTNGVVDL